MVSWFGKASYFTGMRRGWGSRKNINKDPVPGKGRTRYSEFPSVSVFQPALLCHNVYVLTKGEGLKRL